MSESGAKLSVIMPAYNAEKFICDAIDSILSQSLNNLELIIVDDGSTDSTCRKVSAYAAKDGRVRLISVDNSGPAAARNTGLDNVSDDSDYILFCDADDEYRPGAFAALADAARSGADIIISGFTIVNPDGSGSDYNEPDAFFANADTGAYLAGLYKANLLNQVWCKLFRTDFIRKNGFRFSSFRWGEDRLFMFDCIDRAENTAVISECTYLYKMHGTGSLITGFYDKKSDVCIMADKRCRQLCEKFSIEDDSVFRYMFMKSIFSCFTNLFSPSCKLSFQEKKEYISAMINNAYIFDRVCDPAGGSFSKALSLVIRSRSVLINFAAAWVSVLLSTSAPAFFQKIKHKK